MWLREKESAARVSDKDTAHYTPRNSETILTQGRLSRTSADSPRSSMQEARLDALVDEAVVIDDHAIFTRTLTFRSTFSLIVKKIAEIYRHRSLGVIWLLEIVAFCAIS